MTGDTRGLNEKFRGLPRKQRRVKERQFKREIQRVYQEKYESITNTVSLKKETIDEVTRILCMSCPEHSEKTTISFEQAEILMWSHYAKNHSGVRIELDFEHLLFGKSHFAPITYSKKPPMHDWSDGPVPDPLLMLDAVMKKSEAWRYESEVRFFTQPKFCQTETLDNCKEISFLPIPVELVRRVDFGLNMDEKKQIECTKILKKEYPHVKIYKANFNPAEYRLKYEQIK